MEDEEKSLFHTTNRTINPSSLLHAEGILEINIAGCTGRDTRKVGNKHTGVVHLMFITRHGERAEKIRQNNVHRHTDAAIQSTTFDMMETHHRDTYI